MRMPAGGGGGIGGTRTTVAEAGTTRRNDPGAGRARTPMIGERRYEQGRSIVVKKA